MADLVIRGMEMPKKDEILVFDVWHDQMYARSTANTGTRRYEVVQLPEGHGRLSDLDAIIKSFDEMEADFDKKEFFQGACWFHVMAELLRKAPTIVPKEGRTENG